MIIAIDGPGGAGKSVISSKLAKRLGFYHLNSGAIYRAITYYVIANFTLPLSLSSIKQIINFLSGIQNFKIQWDGDKQLEFILNNKNITMELSTSTIDAKVKFVANVPQLREFTNNQIYKLVGNCSVVADGRDMASIVFPNAELNFFLYASLHERAKRRTKQMYPDALPDKIKDVAVEVAKKLNERDEQDKTRAIAPLVRDPKAIFLDTTNMDIPQVINKLIAIVKKSNQFEKHKFNY